VAALLDAAVVAVGRGVNELRHGSGRIGEKVNDVLMQNRSVGLQRETRGAQPAAACSAGGTSTNSCRTRFTSAASLTKAKSTKAGIRLPLPVFVVGAERDHVSPWRSVFKIHYLTGAEITFALVNGGHNRGIVAPPGENGRYFRISTTAAKDRRPDPSAWANSARRHEDSWWPTWFDWLAAHSSRVKAPPLLGSESAGFAPLAPAPGDYVRG
jgi:hypothetical protein